MTETSPEGTNKRWIVVADEATAEFYEQEKKYSPASPLFVMHNDVAREKTGDLISDAGGRSFDSFGAGRHTMAKEETGPKAEQARVFAKLIADRIVAALNAGDMAQFGLIAAPKFLGILRKALGGAHGAEPYVSIDKDIVGQDSAAVDRLLGEL